jgi:L-ascorbate metabolism protein UlaG (beta-lactamase superfamily)
LQDGNGTLLIDPGTLSQASDALAEADGVLITHEHADHIDADALRTAAGGNPALAVWAPGSVAGTLADLGRQVTEVAPDEAFEACGFSIETFGGQHALIHPTVPIVPNICYLVNGTVFHPGDSLIVPTKPVQTLLVPIHAPWSKTAEVVDFVVSMRAPQAFQIHDGLLNETGLQFTEGHVARVGGWHGTEFRHLATGESLTV